MEERMMKTNQQNIMKSQQNCNSVSFDSKKPKKYKLRRYQLKIKRNDSSKGKRKNHWNHFEQRRYIKFLSQSGHLLQLTFVERRNMKVNELMSKRVKSRTAAQCHSHHQKMLLTYQSVEKIIQKHIYLLQNERQYFKTNISKEQVKGEFIKQQQCNISYSQRYPQQCLQHQPKVNEHSQPTIKYNTKIQHPFG